MWFLSTPWGALGCPGHSLGRPGVPREGTGTDFRSISDAPETQIASNCTEIDRNSIHIRWRFDRNAIKIRANFEWDLTEVGQISCPIWSLIWSALIIWSDLVGSHQIGILDQISCSHFLFKFLDQISWSIFPITLWSAWFEFLSNLVELPVRSDLWSDLTWSFDLIWSDLIRSKLLIKFLDRISCSSLLIKFLDPSFRSWYLFIQIFSNFSFNFVGHPFRSVPFLFGSLFHRVQISCSNLLILLPIMCLFLLTPFSSTVNGYWRVLTSIYIYRYLCMHMRVHTFIDQYQYRYTNTEGYDYASIMCGDLYALTTSKVRS